jgi:hypothetical protein
MTSNTFGWLSVAVLLILCAAFVYGKLAIATAYERGYKDGHSAGYASGAVDVIMAD